MNLQEGSSLQQLLSEHLTRLENQVRGADQKLGLMMISGLVWLTGLLIFLLMPVRKTDAAMTLFWLITPVLVVPGIFAFWRLIPKRKPAQDSGAPQPLSPEVSARLSSEDFLLQAKGMYGPAGTLDAHEAALRHLSQSIVETSKELTGKLQFMHRAMMSGVLILGLMVVFGVILSFAPGGRSQSGMGPSHMPSAVGPAQMESSSGQ